MPPKPKNTPKPAPGQDGEVSETILQPVKPGFIRYSAPEIQSLNSERHHYQAAGGFIDLPENHEFRDSIGASIFEIQADDTEPTN